MHPHHFPSMESSNRPTLDTKLHTKYWQRCLKSLLPTEYQASDSSRLLLAFLILAALDVLGSPVSDLPRAELLALRQWILSCQHPSGGFCGSPNHKYPQRYYKQSRDIDPANLPATFFGILSLAFVGGLEKVDRTKTLLWLTKLQRPDGSFGELIENDGKIGGGKDMRYCHFASGVRRLLRGDITSLQGLLHGDIDVNGLVRHIRAGETYDGGIAESSEHEAHAGYTYCAIASLSFLGRLPSATYDKEAPLTGLRNVPATVKWLLSRQMVYEDEEESEEEEEDGIGADMSKDSSSVHEPPSLSGLSLQNPQQVGCNGRCNKKADTCYCFWVGASLQIIQQDSLINKEGFRRFLLEQTQHRIGGFGKGPGMPPDLYHSYLGLVALAIMGEPGLRSVDPVFCISIEAKASLEKSIALITTTRANSLDGETLLSNFKDDEASPKLQTGKHDRINAHQNRQHYEAVIGSTIPA